MFGVCKDASVHRIRFRWVLRMVELDEQRGQNVSSCVERKTTASCVRHERMSAAECGFDDNSRARRESMTPTSAKTSVQAHAVFLTDFQHAGF